MHDIHAFYCFIGHYCSQKSLLGFYFAQGKQVNAITIEEYSFDYDSSSCCLE